MTPPFVKALCKEDERRAADVLEAFNGAGMVRLLDHTRDTLVMERLDPGSPLSFLVAADDAEATAILARVISAFAPPWIPDGTPTAADWGRSFEDHLARGRREIPEDLVRRAHGVYRQLSSTQRQTRLLHGDLHHDNVLFDSTRGWVAIDPKGVVGELEYEVGAALRNPLDLPRIFTDATVIDSRVQVLSDALHLDSARVVGWAFAQAVLAMIWLVEDGEPVPPHHTWLSLARALETRCSPFS